MYQFQGLGLFSFGMYVVCETLRNGKFQISQSDVFFFPLFSALVIHSSCSFLTQKQVAFHLVTEDADSL